MENPGQDLNRRKMIIHLRSRGPQAGRSSRAAIQNYGHMKSSSHLNQRKIGPLQISHNGSLLSHLTLMISREESETTSSSNQCTLRVLSIRVHNPLVASTVLMISTSKTLSISSREIRHLRPQMVSLLLMMMEE